MKLLKLAPSQRVQGRWLLHLEDGSLLRGGENEVVSFGLYAGMELSGERLEELCAAAARLVRNGGRFALCHRPERLTDVVCTLRASGLEPKRLKLVSHGPGHPPALLLVEGVRQGKPGLTIEE